jgi:hypothetical protein
MEGAETEARMSDMSISMSWWMKMRSRWTRGNLWKERGRGDARGRVERVHLTSPSQTCISNVLSSVT